MYKPVSIHNSIIYKTGHVKKKKPNTQIDKTWPSRTGILLTLKKNEILTHAMAWVNIEDTLLSEISQPERNKYHMAPFTWGEVGECTQAETKMAFARAWAEENNELVLFEHSFNLEDGKLWMKKAAIITQNCECTGHCWIAHMGQLKWQTILLSRYY